jgi:hypothetical protein
VRDAEPERKVEEGERSQSSVTPRSEIEDEDEFEDEDDLGIGRRDQGKKNTRDNPGRGLLWRFLFVQVS